MKAGNLNTIFFILMFVFFSTNISSQEQLILENLEPTFEEESLDTNPNKKIEEISNLKSKNKKKFKTNETVVNIRALDKITAKTSDIDVIVGQKKKFGYLEIFPKKCTKSKEEDSSGVIVYIQVRDLSEKKDDKIFIFNGWTFSSSPTLRTFDHPVYDLWVTGCENI